MFERDLSEVLASPGRLRPVFQPILSLATGTIVGYEGFSRFVMSPRRPPDTWFTEASRVGMGARLQAHAITQILGSAARAGLPAGTFLALNVSPRYLDHPAVGAAFSMAEPTSLVIELTEEEAVLDYQALRRAMVPYLKRGVRFAVDDAGAGFASMRHVIELQPALVKLDAWLISGIRNRRTLRAFLRSINDFTTEIGAVLVAEGVESTSDLAVLAETGFQILAQGFAIGKPGPPWGSGTAASINAWREGSENRR